MIYHRDERESLIDDLAAMGEPGDDLVLAYLEGKFSEIEADNAKNRPKGKDVPAGCIASPIGLMVGAAIAVATRNDMYLGMIIGTATGFGVALLASRLGKKSKSK